MVSVPYGTETLMVEQQTEPRVSLVRQAVHGKLHVRETFVDPELKQKVEAGTHRFDIHPSQVIFLRPQGFLVDRAEDRRQRLAKNEAAIKLWERRYVEVTDDGFIVREREMPKPKLKLVQSNGA